MSFVTLAAIRHASKRFRGSASARYEASCDDEERFGTLKALAPVLVGTLFTAALFVGITLAEQTGIAWLSLVLQALLFLFVFALGFGVIAGVFLAGLIDLH